MHPNIPNNNNNISISRSSSNGRSGCNYDNDVNNIFNINDRCIIISINIIIIVTIMHYKKILVLIVIIIIIVLILPNSLTHAGAASSLNISDTYDISSLLHHDPILLYN
jgi:hypothetical protein